MIYAHERRVAIEAVRQAAQLCVNIRTSMVGGTALHKGDKSPVTLADFGSQALVCRYLKAAFPADVIVAEEDASELRKPEHAASLALVTHYVHQQEPEATAEKLLSWIDAGGGTLAHRFWTLDPIDGTKGYLRNDQYAVALALIVDGDVKVGVLACPGLPVDLHDPTSATGVLFVAVRGEGASTVSLVGGLERRIHTARGGNGAGLRFVESVEAAHGNHRLQEEIAAEAGIVEPPLRMDSQAKYGVVARGDAALYLRLPSPASPDYRENIWDHAAGALIVEEAGGSVTDMDGQQLNFTGGPKLLSNRGVIVSNGQLHAVVIDRLRQKTGMAVEPAHDRN